MSVGCRGKEGTLPFGHILQLIHFVDAMGESGGVLTVLEEPNGVGGADYEGGDGKAGPQDCHCL